MPPWRQTDPARGAEAAEKSPADTHFHRRSLLGSPRSCLSPVNQGKASARRGRGHPRWQLQLLSIPVAFLFLFLIFC